MKKLCRAIFVALSCRFPRTKLITSWSQSTCLWNYTRSKTNYSLYTLKWGKVDFSAIRGRAQGRKWAGNAKCIPFGTKCSRRSLTLGSDHASKSAKWSLVERLVPPQVKDTEQENPGWKLLTRAICSRSMRLWRAKRKVNPPGLTHNWLL